MGINGLTEIQDCQFEGEFPGSIVSGLPHYDIEEWLDVVKGVCQFTKAKLKPTLWFDVGDNHYVGRFEFSTLSQDGRENIFRKIRNPKDLKLNLQSLFLLEPQFDCIERVTASALGHVLDAKHIDYPAGVLVEGDRIVASVLPFAKGRPTSYYDCGPAERGEYDSLTLQLNRCGIYFDRCGSNIVLQDEGKYKFIDLSLDVDELSWINPFALPDGYIYAPPIYNDDSRKIFYGPKAINEFRRTEAYNSWLPLFGRIISGESDLRFNYYDVANGEAVILTPEAVELIAEEV